MGKSTPFSTLVAKLPGLLARRGDTSVSGIASDSREVQPGDVFVAYRGFEADGHDFIEHALVSGAVAVVFDNPRHETTVEGVPWARVQDARVASAELAESFFEHPSRELLLAAVTGTNGKTTTTFLIESILTATGLDAGVIGTLGYGPVDNLAESPRTTPDAIELQRRLRSMADAGIDGVAMEVSSHSLVLHRPWLCSFDVGVFTNLSQDHLDFHRDLEAYLEAKLLLFTEYAEQSHKPMVGAVNLDDEFGRQIAARASCPVIGYGLGQEADVRAVAPELSEDGSTFELVLPSGRARVELSLPGAFNVQNALAAAAAAEAMDIAPEAIAEGLSRMASVPGRFEVIDEGQQFAVIVDYAHTPEALENVLNAAGGLSDGRLICVFGCGGDRDPEKRPQMGRIATERADRVIITSDNPRSEEPEAIIDQIVRGVATEEYAIEADRRSAIRQAVHAARPGDVVVIAGKGHEAYQIFADRTIDFDDRQVARELLDELLSDRAAD